MAVFLQWYHLAYVVTDRALQVVEVFDPHRLLTASDEVTPEPTLFDLAPELLGAEDLLGQMLAGQVQSHVLELVSRDTPSQETRYLRMVVAPQRADGSSPSGLILLVNDVTEMGRLEQRVMQSRNDLALAAQALEHKNQQLVAANRELGRLAEIRSAFVSVAAHELRTPLTVISGYVDVLLSGAMGQLSAPQHEALTALLHSVQRLSALVNNLLDVARLETGRLELVLQPLDLGEIAVKAVDELRPLLAASRHELSVVVQPHLPAALCDEVRAYQVLTNLLSNAARYTPAGGRIEVAVTLAENPGEILFSVRDNGIGIPQEDWDKLGAMFFRARNADTVFSQGTGLGLYIIRSLMQMHGGRFWFESVEGQGTTFYVTFLRANGPHQ